MGAHAVIKVKTKKEGLELTMTALLESVTALLEYLDIFSNV